jgi:hypothetical protein
VKLILQHNDKGPLIHHRKREAKRASVSSF